MNNKQLIKQITKDLKLCSEWSEKNKVIMEEYNNRNCDLCEGCNKHFDQYRDVLRNDDINNIWNYHLELGNDEGDLCADCILNLDYCVDKCLECEELYDRNTERDELTTDEMEIWGKCVDDGLDSGDLCVRCLLKDTKQIG